MTRAKHICEKMDRMLEDHDAMSPEDTIIQNQKYPDGGWPKPCPTCSKEITPGFMSPSLMQCPSCMTNIDIHSWTPTSIRTLSGNKVAADGIVRKGMD